jgi:hypothetical protein
MPRLSVSLFRIPVLPLLLLGGPLAVAQSLPQASPFLPAPNAAPAAANATSDYELVGMVAQSSGMLLSVMRKSDKHSFWLPVGGTVDEVTAVSYNAVTDEAVIHANSRTFTLKMRKAVIVPGKNPIPVVARAPAPTPAAPASTPDAPPAPAAAPRSEQEQKEFEARMLVSDLLEIGQQQRKAYAEAQRQAAERNAKAAGTPAARPANAP